MDQARTVELTENGKNAAGTVMGRFLRLSGVGIPNAQVRFNSLGGEWDNEIELGRIRRYGTEFYQPLNVGNWLFASAYGTVQSVPEYVFLGDTRIAEYDVDSVEAGLDGGTQFGNYGEARLGYRYYRYKARPEIAVPGFPSLEAREYGARLLVRWDSLDHPYFPQRGNKTKVELFAGRRSTALGGTDLGARRRRGREEEHGDRERDGPT